MKKGKRLQDRIDFEHHKEIDIAFLEKNLKTYPCPVNISRFKKACTFAQKAHQNQKRHSGEDYIIHPFNVAYILIQLNVDEDTLIAGVLHDVIEDCEITYEEIASEFSQTVAEIVLGLTKISKIKIKNTTENQVENFRKMIVAMAKNFRVIIIKLVDRLHNMMTLEHMREEKQKIKAQETLDIYVPLAGRLGIHSIKAELEDLCLRYLKPEIYYRLANSISEKKSERNEYIEQVISSIVGHLQENSLVAEVTGRSKHFFSIYKKMENRGVSFGQIFDLLAFRIIVSDITNCYRTLGIIHSAYRPIPGRFKDYIAIPKINNYQSLHTSVFGPDGKIIEIQIRTEEMHLIAERGVAAHWQYKENNKNSQISWIKDILEYTRDSQSSSDFYNYVKDDLDIGGVFVFTPNGDVRELKRGATPLDFAYSIHTEIGHKCVGAKVNSKMVPLRYRLKSGDSVEILTNKQQTPSKDWLKIVRSARAKSKIKQWLLKEEREKNHALGQNLLEKEVKKINLDFKEFIKKAETKKAIEQLKLKDSDELYIALGSKRLLVKDFFERNDLTKSIIREEITTPKVPRKKENASSGDNAIIVDGRNNISVRIARCCNPIPGDKILGFITRLRGITIHRLECSNILDEDTSRTVSVSWGQATQYRHPVSIRVRTTDRKGLLATISDIIGSLGINIRSAYAKSMPDRKGDFIFEIEIRDHNDLLRCINAVEKTDEVISVGRI